MIPHRPTEFLFPLHKVMSAMKIVNARTDRVCTKELSFLNIRITGIRPSTIRSAHRADARTPNTCQWSKMWKDSPNPCQKRNAGSSWAISEFNLFSETEFPKSTCQHHNVGTWHSQVHSVGTNFTQYPWQRRNILYIVTSQHYVHLSLQNRSFGVLK